MSEPVFTPVTAPPDESDHDHWFLLQDGKLIIVDDMTDGPRALRASEAAVLRASVEAPLVLGAIDGFDGHWWTGHLDASIDLASIGVAGVLPRDLRSLMPELDATTWNIAGRAAQIADWYRDHQKCGRCGTDMEMAAKDRSMRCPVDGLVSYPRLSPAVIVLVENKAGEALLAQNVAWTTGMYSTLAGFVEPGESLEDCVHREIGEEVGITVTDLEYFQSQPWPFPNSLMVGFFAQHAEGELVPAPDEIADAQWYPRDNLPQLPMHGSIARALVDEWLLRRG